MPISEKDESSLSADWRIEPSPAPHIMIEEATPRPLIYANKRKSMETADHGRDNFMDAFMQNPELKRFKSQFEAIEPYVARRKNYN